MYSHYINNPLYKDLQYIDFLVLMTDEDKNIIKEHPITEKLVDIITYPIWYKDMI